MRLLVIKLSRRFDMYKLIISKEGGVFRRLIVFWKMVSSKVEFFSVVIVDSVKLMMVRIRKKVGLFIIKEWLFGLFVLLFGEDCVDFFSLNFMVV